MLSKNKGPTFSQKKIGKKCTKTDSPGNSRNLIKTKKPEKAFPEPSWKKKTGKTLENKLV